MKNTLNSNNSVKDFLCKNQPGSTFPPVAGNVEENDIIDVSDNPHSPIIVEVGGRTSKRIRISSGMGPLFYKWPLEHTSNRPVIALDVFDTPPPLPRVVKDYYKGFLEDPCSWAEKAVKEYGADMVSIHFPGLDPSILNRPVREAAEIAVEVLDRIKVPIIVGGCGNPRKDLEFFREVAEMASGEGIVLASVTVNMDIGEYAKLIVDHGHVALALAFMNISQLKYLSRKLVENGVPRNKIILDPSTGGLGYGLEYSFSIIETIKLGALRGDVDLQSPICIASSNAWAAREAWMKNPLWGDRKWRGPLWEAITAMTLILAGADMAMMLHPLSAKIVKRCCESITRVVDLPKAELVEKYMNWISPGGR